MRRAILLTLAIALGLGGSEVAVAAETSLFGNTLQITSPDGGVTRYYLNTDGSYTGVLSGGRAVAGTWAEVDGQLCFTQQSPTQGGALCGPLITQSVGQTWTGTRPDGSVSTLTIIAGR